MVQLNDEGIEPLFPTLSSDTTSKIMNTFGEIAILDRTDTSSKVEVINTAFNLLDHSPIIFEDPLSLPENVKVIEDDIVLLPLTSVPLFPSIAVLMAVVGGNVSTVQLNRLE